MASYTDLRLCLRCKNQNLGISVYCEFCEQFIVCWYKASSEPISNRLRSCIFNRLDVDSRFKVPVKEWNISAAACEQVFAASTSGCETEAVSDFDEEQDQLDGDLARLPSGLFPSLDRCFAASLATTPCVLASKNCRRELSFK